MESPGTQLKRLFYWLRVKLVTLLAICKYFEKRSQYVERGVSVNQLPYRPRGKKEKLPLFNVFMKL